MMSASTNLSAVVIIAHGASKAVQGSSWLGTLTKIGSVLGKAARFAVDFVPIAGGLVDIYEGIRDGDGWQVAGGVLSVVADGLSLGSASVAKGLIKNTVKQVGRIAKESKVIDEVATLTKKLVKHSPCGCFVAGTKVLTENGYKSIEELRPGDVVLAYNDTTGVYGAKKVLHVFEYTRDTIYQVSLGSEIINTTSDHPFFIGGRWLRVAELKVGDEVVNYEGKKIAISAITPIAKRTTVHNFEVADFHTYYVSDSKVLVHNSGPCPFKNKVSYKGNNTLDSRKAELYNLKNRTTGDVDKIGETINGEFKGKQTRYSQTYLDKENVDYVPQKVGTKKGMHKKQHKDILKYKKNNGGKRPRLNKNDY